MDENFLSNAQKSILTENIKTHLKEIFFNSFKNLTPTKDSISFAYGWCLLAYSTEYKIIEDKLSVLKSEIVANSLNKNIEFIIEPTLKLAQLCSAQNEILETMGLRQFQINSKIDLIIEFVTEAFNSFLMTIYKFKQQLDEISEEEQKNFIFKEISNFYNYM